MIAAKAQNPYSISALLNAGASFEDSEIDLKQFDYEWIKSLFYMRGMGGWNRLMVMVHFGSDPEPYFRHLSMSQLCFDCIHSRSSFPKWFLSIFEFYSSLSGPEQWKWGKYDTLNVVLDESGMKATKVSDHSDYSAVLGSIEFEEGIHCWEVMVDDVESMWLGIARGVEESGGLGSYPGQCEYLLAFHSEGSPDLVGKLPSIVYFSSPVFSSGQKVGFELNTHQHILKMFVDGELATVSYNVDDRGARPYACMDYSESIELLKG